MPDAKAQSCLSGWTLQLSTVTWLADLPDRGIPGLFEQRGGRGGEGCLEETAVVAGGGCGCRKGASLKKDKAGGGLGGRAQRLPSRLW